MPVESLDEERLEEISPAEQDGRNYIDALNVQVEQAEVTSTVELDDTSMQTLEEIASAAFADLGVEGGLIAVAAGNAVMGTERGQ